MIPHRLLMKKTLFIQACLIGLIALGLDVFSTAARGADRKTNIVLSATNAVPQEAPAPKAEFSLAEPYKDPFFPNSMRHHVQLATNNVAPVMSVAQFKVRGFSGLPGQEVVLINNRNFATGEHNEVTLPNGTIVGITVLKIEGYNVTILPDGQRETLLISLPKDDQ